MPTNNEAFRDAEFEAAFGADEPAAAGLDVDADLDDTSTPEVDAAAAETATPPEGEPAAVVIVAAADDRDAQAIKEAEANAAAAKEAKTANDDANPDGADKDAGASGKETGSQEVDDSTSTPDASTQTQAADGGSETSEDDEPTDPKELQRKRSWEGRLRAEEERLKRLAKDLEAKAGKPAAAASETTEADGSQQSTADALGQAADEAAAGGDQQKADAINAVADQVASGDISVEEAMQAISDDFGPQFTKMIQAVASKAAAEAVSKQFGDRLGKVEKDAQTAISEIDSAAKRQHYQTIYNAHPDFVELTDEPGFDAFVKATPGADVVVERGSAKDINKLLDAYKASKQAAPAQEEPTPAQDAVAAAQATQQAPAVDPAAIDAAEGVRSAGLRVPEQPSRAKNDDYESAWNEF